MNHKNLQTEPKDQNELINPIEEFQRSIDQILDKSIIDEDNNLVYMGDKDE